MPYPTQEPRPVLVTGAAGLIGYSLALELQRRGHEVTGLDLRARPAPFRMHAGDVRDARLLEKLVP